MVGILRKLWPYFLGLALFIGMSTLARSHLALFMALLSGNASPYGMGIYVIVGILTVIVPFASILPFLPIAVVLWGWPATGLLTILAWVLGSQILFETSRALGKPLLSKVIPASQREYIAGLVTKGGIVHSILVRMFVHGDIVSYGFGMFTTVSRWEFLFVTAVGVAPGAFVYAYAGALPVLYQAALAIAGLSLLAAYWMLEAKRPHLVAPLTSLSQKLDRAFGKIR